MNFRWGIKLSLGSSFAASEVVSESDSGIFARVQVAALPFEKNFDHLPRRPTRFWIKVGSNTQNLIRDYADFGGDDDFLLSFEPLLDKYGYLLATLPVERDGQRRKLGFQHERGLAFPFAVGSCETALFHVAEHDMCSSMYRGRDSPDHAIDDAPAGCRSAEVSAARGIRPVAPDRCNDVGQGAES